MGSYITAQADLKLTMYNGLFYLMQIYLLQFSEGQDYKCDLLGLACVKVFKSAKHSWNSLIALTKTMFSKINSQNVKPSSFFLFLNVCNASQTN